MDAGNLGESILTKWCHQVDLIPNKATIDKDGWDFLIALPKVYDDELKSLDKDDSHDRILIQVKTTKSEKGNRDIKVSNLKKLIDTSMPSFYLIIQVSEEGEPIKAHLFHVWEKIITKVQKRLRSIPKEKWNKLNKFELRLPWKTAQKMKHLQGVELNRLVKKNLTKTKKEYSNKKNELREKVGYEKGTGKIHFRSILPEKYEGDLDEFINDLYLGEIDKVELLNFEMIDKRFGEEVVVKKEKGGNFKLINIEPEGQAKLKFQTVDFRSVVEITTEFFIPKGVGQIVKDEEKWKVLYKAPFIKFFVYPKGSKINFTFDIPDFRKEAKISELLGISNLILFLSEIEDEEKIFIEIIKEEKPYIGGTLFFSKYTDQVPIDFFRAIKSANRILNFLNIDNDLYVKPIDLKAQLDVINFIYELLAPKPLYMKFGFWVKADLQKYRKTICLLPFTISIGNYVIPMEVKVEGCPDKTGDLEGGKNYYCLESSNVRIEQYRIFKRNKAKIEISHNEMKELSLKKYDVDDVMVVHFDKNAENES